MKNILILGSEGMLGYAAELYFKSKNLYNVISLNRNDFDVIKNSISDLIPYIEKSDLVLNCIGIIKQVIDRYNPIDIFKINGIFPKNLAILCNILQKKLIHISTDCAYSGKKGNYTENDIFDAEDIYGISKICGETDECMTLRTSIIGPEKKQSNISFLAWALSQKGKTVNGFTNHFWNGITTFQFAEITEIIIKKNLYQKGVFHIFSPNNLSKYDLLNIINNIFDIKLNIVPYETQSLCNRTLNTVKDLNSKLNIPSIQEQIKNIIRFIKY